MDDIEKRKRICGVYKNPRWAEKVNKMPRAQIHAIYMRLSEQNVFED